MVKTKLNFYGVYNTFYKNFKKSVFFFIDSFLFFNLEFFFPHELGVFCIKKLSDFLIFINYTLIVCYIDDLFDECDYCLQKIRNNKCNNTYIFNVSVCSYNKSINIFLKC